MQKCFSCFLCASNTDSHRKHENQEKKKKAKSAEILRKRTVLLGQTKCNFGIFKIKKNIFHILNNNSGNFWSKKLFFRKIKRFVFIQREHSSSPNQIVCQITAYDSKHNSNVSLPRFWKSLIANFSTWIRCKNWTGDNFYLILFIQQ